SAMRLILFLLSVLCDIATTVPSDSTIEPESYTKLKRGVGKRRNNDIESKSNSTIENITNCSTINPMFMPLYYADLMIPIVNSTTEINVVDEPISSKAKTIGLFSLIVIGGVGIGMVAILMCCCWIEKRRLRRLATEMSDRPEEIGVHQVNRPLILENNGSAEVPVDPPSSGIRPVIERILPDPFSPIKYISTPINAESEAHLTPMTEMPTPIEKKELPIATPAKEEKVPELHLDEYK
ncbi:hypothetical protein PENTCL1PPCAC_2598, partial [Pristionchus entomophagus]